MNRKSIVSFNSQMAKKQVNDHTVSRTGLDLLPSLYSDVPRVVAGNTSDPRELSSRPGKILRQDGVRQKVSNIEDRVYYPPLVTTQEDRTVSRKGTLPNRDAEKPLVVSGNASGLGDAYVSRAPGRYEQEGVVQKVTANYEDRVKLTRIDQHTESTQKDVKQIKSDVRNMETKLHKAFLDISAQLKLNQDCERFRKMAARMIDYTSIIIINLLSMTILLCDYREQMKCNEKNEHEIQRYNYVT